MTMELKFRYGAFAKISRLATGGMKPDVSGVWRETPPNPSAPPAFYRYEPVDGASLFHDDVVDTSTFIMGWFYDISTPHDDIREGPFSSLDEALGHARENVLDLFKDKDEDEEDAA
jgi:hypothetical protein